VQLLIDNGAYLDPEDAQCFTPLLLAELLGQKAVADKLMSAGADTRCCSRKGDTLLWAAIEAGDMARVERMIREFKLDPNIQAGKHKWGILHRAIMHIEDLATSERVVSQMLQLCAKSDLKTSEDKTPLYFAVYRGSAPMVRVLLQAGANPNQLDIAQNCPLHFVRTAEVTALLLDRGAKSMQRNKQSNTPLHAAVAFLGPNHEVTQLLHRRGADSRLKNKWGHTPFEVANYEKQVFMPFFSTEESLWDSAGLLLCPPGKR